MTPIRSGYGWAVGVCCSEDFSSIDDILLLSDNERLAMLDNNESSSLSNGAVHSSF